MKKIMTLSFASLLACATAPCVSASDYCYDTPKKRQTKVVQIFNITPDSFKDRANHTTKNEKRERDGVQYNVTVYTFKGEVDSDGNSRKFPHWGWKKDENITIADAKATLRLIPTRDYSGYTDKELYMVSWFVDDCWKSKLEQCGIIIHGPEKDYTNPKLFKKPSTSAKKSSYRLPV